jgi:uncharacterized protein involved in exopolysaccharide biosynthesis
MNENHQTELKHHRIDPYEDEIELMDYLLVIWKWKYLILIGTLVCAVAAAVISLQMDKVYSIQTVLQPGRLKVTEDGKTIFISSAKTIKAIIETGTFDNRILSKVKTANRDDLPETLEFSIKIPKNSNALDISYETSDVDLGLQILNNLNEALLEKYGKLIRYYQEDYDIKVRLKSNEKSKLTEKMAKVRNAISIIEAESKTAISEIEANISSKKAEISSSEAEKETKISEIEAKISSKKAEIATKEAKKVVAIDQKDNSISTLKAQIAAKKKQIKNLLDRISDVKIEIGRISKNTDLLIEERNKFLSSTKDKDNILASVMYTNTIQQNIGYLNTLRSTVNSVNHQLFQESASIENLQNNIKDIYAQKNSIENQTKYNIENLKSEIKDQRVQIVGFGKQTKYNIENLRSDIKDLRTQNVSLKEQTKYKVENLKEEIKALKSEKEYILQEVKDLEFKKSFVQNIQILQPPKSSPYPIRPKTTLYIILSLVAGLFLMLFLSFFLEYLSKHKWTQER